MISMSTYTEALDMDSQAWGFSELISCWDTESSNELMPSSEPYTTSSNERLPSLASSDTQSQKLEAKLNNTTLILPDPKVTRVRLATRRTLSQNQENYQDENSENNVERFCNTQPSTALVKWLPNTNSPRPHSLGAASQSEREPRNLSPSLLNSSVTSASPLTPINRLRKRLLGKPATTWRKFLGEDKTDSRSEGEKYQTLLTHYFKAKREINQLKNQNKQDQKRIAILEWQRQQEAIRKEVLMEEENESSKRKNMKSSSLPKQEHDDNNNFDEPNDVENTGVDKEMIREETGQTVDTERIQSFYSEVTKYVADTITDRSLRPTVLQISIDSPANKIPEIFKKLTSSGRLCERCGSRVGNNTYTKK